jgi:predicted amidophosphoribosyltransferase
MFLVEVLRELVRPAVCLACGAPGAWPCCVRCLPTDPGDVGPWPLAADPDVALWALGPYRDALRAAVLAGKLDGQPAALTELGRRLGIALAAAGVGADLVTYVAAARVAGAPRDHAARVAAGVAAALDLPLVGLLAAAGGPDLGRARRAGRSDRPPPRRPPPTARYRLAGGRILLVDDLATTGGTLAGAAATLRHAGGRQVEAAVLAAAPTALGVGVAPGNPATRSARQPGGPVHPATRATGSPPPQPGRRSPPQPGRRSSPRPGPRSPPDRAPPPDGGTPPPGQPSAQRRYHAPGPPPAQRRYHAPRPPSAERRHPPSRPVELRRPAPRPPPPVLPALRPCARPDSPVSGRVPAVAGALGTVGRAVRRWGHDRICPAHEGRIVWL